ncbi:hypothetical protein Tco_0968314 [Tanacetum coccineum]
MGRFVVRSNASTKFKDKEIAKPITPPSESASEEDSDPEQAQRDKDINKNVDTSPRYNNDNQTRQFGNQRTVTGAGAKETVGSQVVHYMAKIQEVPTADSGTDTEPLEQTNQNAKQCDDERVALANLIASLTLDTEENKKILKQLKKENASLT